eukprot:TRINITY_DN3477_c0_g2_i2.p1 TRINITY_DN3477_c0_g2~~TRINITY_DN3477_c0_g2_i2.p1  ORF type:complete len:447 (+),score=79.23 TRINITY_DN3477_c0_g2_i2:889-2229(+)
MRRMNPNFLRLGCCKVMTEMIPYVTPEELFELFKRLPVYHLAQLDTFHTLFDEEDGDGLSKNQLNDLQDFLLNAWKEIRKSNKKAKRKLKLRKKAKKATTTMSPLSPVPDRTIGKYDPVAIYDDKPRGASDSKWLQWGLYHMMVLYLMSCRHRKTTPTAKLDKLIAHLVNRSTYSETMIKQINPAFLYVFGDIPQARLERFTLHVAHPPHWLICLAPTDQVVGKWLSVAVKKKGRGITWATWNSAEDSLPLLLAIPNRLVIPALTLGLQAKVAYNRIEIEKALIRLGIRYPDDVIAALEANVTNASISRRSRAFILSQMKPSKRLQALAAALQVKEKDPHIYSTLNTIAETDPETISTANTAANNVTTPSRVKKRGRKLFITKFSAGDVHDTIHAIEFMRHEFDEQWDDIKSDISARKTVSPGDYDKLQEIFGALGSLCSSLHKNS